MSITPLPLGAHVRVVAPASPPKKEEAIPQSTEFLRSLGFRVSLGSAIGERAGFLAGSDKARVRDLHTAFRTRSVDGVICLRGGYGTQRILPLLSMKEIAATRKPLIGFSDITALLLSFARYGGWAIHGPMAASLMNDSAVSPFSRDHLIAALTEPARERSLLEGYPEKDETVEVVRSGTANGRLVGGNLAILTSLLGTPWFPNLRNAILFLEEVGEAPYRIDRMLTHLINSGVLEGVRGVAVGLCASCEFRDGEGQPQGPTWRSVVRERLYPLKIPVVVGLPFGHVSYNAAIPVGQFGLLDAKRRDLVVGGKAARGGLRRVK